MSDPKRQLGRPRLLAKSCINCGRHFTVARIRHWYGANEVGPFCEVCDATIKLHTRFKERESG